MKYLRKLIQASVLLVFFVSNIRVEAVSICTFTRDLTVGSVGEDVRCLQQYLNSTGYTITESNEGSLGQETTYFGTLTAQALARWQSNNGVSPATGYFGPVSRAKYSSFTSGVSNGAGGTVSGQREAASSINEAVYTISEVYDKVRNSKNSKAVGLWEDADELLDDAEAAYNKKQYDLALDFAEAAIEKADEAESALSSKTASTSEAKSEARDAIADAEKAIDDAKDEIDEADDDGDDVDEAESILDDAREALNDAEEAYDDKDYDEAIELAEEAQDAADEAVDAIGEEPEDDDDEDDEDDEQISVKLLANGKSGTVKTNSDSVALTWTSNAKYCEASSSYSAAGSSSSLANKTISILPIGDSNTAGVGNPTNCTKNCLGYRKSLKDLLTAANIKTDFVGSKSDGNFTDNQHEGWSGEGISKIQSRISGGILGTLKPDIALLLIGSNDMWISLSDRSPVSDNKANYWVSQLGKLLDAMYGKKSDMHVIVAKPATPRSASGPLAIYRDGIDTLVKQKKTDGQKISSVDLMGAKNDGTHYTSTGFETVANLWAAEIKSIVSGSSAIYTAPSWSGQKSAKGSKSFSLAPGSETTFSLRCGDSSSSLTARSNVTVKVSSSASSSSGGDSGDDAVDLYEGMIEQLVETMGEGFDEVGIPQPFACPLKTESDDDRLVNFSTVKGLLGKSSGSTPAGFSSNGQADYQVSIPAGTYKVSMTTYDNHSEHGGQGQRNEKVYLELYDGADGDMIAKTDSTDDISESSNSVTTIIADALEVDSQVKMLRTIHAAYPNGSSAESVFPICTLFESTDEDPEDDEEKEAEDAVDRAIELIDEAKDAIDDSDASDRKIELAEDIIDDAEDLVDDATEAIDDEDYDEAIELAEEAQDFAKEAADIVGEKIGDDEESDAEEAIEDAEDAIDAAEEAIDESDADADDIEEAEDLVDEANDLLDEAEEAFDDEDYDDAIDAAEEAQEKAEEAEELVD
ncbi:MAG TPA: peptidoglycan-binding protein [Candidatus Paceibacterota bacterium]|nr:peptidoglycan-binding protein [Candidatus Paceibacterota bacterium]HRZ34415.1 peptidoglycan-binding protein [Candidatus Paceibacterota bacterium]